jgi:hypothetical protein
MFGVFVNFRTVVISHTHIERLFSLNGYLLENGGPDRVRTCDLLLAKQLLYQLRYEPKI